MDLTETIHMLRWVSNIDARVMFSEPAVEMWQHALEPVTAAEAKQAVLDHYRTNDQFPATHAGIRKRALNLRDTIKAQHRAIEATPASTTIKHPNSWRARNPEKWDALFEQGRIDGNEERMRNAAKLNGIPSTHEDGELHQFNYNPDDYRAPTEYDPYAA